jgi:exopolysaccharide biosynthesis protein
MKRTLLGMVAVLLIFSATAQTSDSVKFATAPRQELKLPKGAEGYTIVKTNIFDSHQTVSVIRYSPKRFKTAIIQPEKLTRLSASAEAVDAAFGINAGYWNVSTSEASTYIQLNGEQLSVTADFEKTRVDGVACIAARRIILDYCKAGNEDAHAKRFQNILAAGPMLIDEGKVVVDDERPVTSSFYTHRHPRTVLGTDKRGNIYLVVVDGRSKGNAAGMSIDELTQLCRWLGLRDALNLDGGGSTSMWTAEEGIINHPSDNGKFDHAGERRISSCIVVKSKR